MTELIAFPQWLVFLHRLFSPQSPPLPSGCLPTVNRNPHPGIALQSLRSSSQPLCLLGDLSGVCMAAARIVCAILIPLDCHRSVASLSASNVSPLTQRVAPCGDQTLALVPPPTEGRSSPANSPNSPVPPPSFVPPSFAWFCVSFPLAGTPAHSQLVLCTRFCV